MFCQQEASPTIIYNNNSINTAMKMFQMLGAIMKDVHFQRVRRKCDTAPMIVNPRCLAVAATELRHSNIPEAEVLYIFPTGETHRGDKQIRSRLRSLKE